MDQFISNRALMSKAAVDSSTLGAGGKMNAEQSKKFITYMKEYSQFLSWVHLITMSTTRRVLENLEINARAMRKQKENEDNSATGTATTSQRELTAVGTIMPYDVTFQFMKENIEGANINSTLAKMFAQQFINDTLDLAFNGDEASADNFLSINDGWLRIAERDTGSHKYDMSGVTSPMAIFRGILSMLPSKYYELYKTQDKSKIKLLVPHGLNQAYKEELTSRNTALGDSLLVGGKNVAYDGYEIVPVGFLPERTTMVCALENLAYGVYGQSLETYHQVNPRKTRHEYTLMADFDFEFHNIDAIVVGKDRT